MQPPREKSLRPSELSNGRAPPPPRHKNPIPTTVSSFTLSGRLNLASGRSFWCVLELHGRRVIVGEGRRRLRILSARRTGWYGMGCLCLEAGIFLAAARFRLILLLLLELLLLRCILLTVPCSFCLSGGGGGGGYTRHSRTPMCSAATVSGSLSLSRA